MYIYALLDKAHKPSGCDVYNHTKQIVNIYMYIRIYLLRHAVIHRCTNTIKW